MNYRYNVELRMKRAGLYEAVETNTGVSLGRVCSMPNENAWFVAHLCGRAGLVKCATLEAVKWELERYCQANPREIDGAHRAILAQRARAISTEPVEPAPALQGAMPL